MYLGDNEIKEVQIINNKDQNKIKNTIQSDQALINCSNRKVYDLHDRLLTFSKRIMEICKLIPHYPECYNIRMQLADAGSSIGANYAEADGALTKKDFINKIGIARKEAKETKYWLKLIDGSFIKESSMIEEIRETEEIICILSSILFKSGFRKRL